jgi:hypothetical protein
MVPVGEKEVSQQKCTTPHLPPHQLHTAAQLVLCTVSTILKLTFHPIPMFKNIRNKKFITWGKMDKLKVEYKSEYLDNGCGLQ